jgi:Predicted protein-tyrosine phosphatase
MKSNYKNENIIKMIMVRSTNTSEILPTNGVIFIGSNNDAGNKKFLQKRHIVGIINAAEECPVNMTFPFAYLKLHLIDIPSQDILQVLPTVYTFLENNLSVGNVLVHCAMGISRSVSLVIGYLLLKFPVYNYNHIYDYVRSHRQIAYPNSGFKEQLISLQQSLN